MPPAQPLASGRDPRQRHGPRLGVSYPGPRGGARKKAGAAAG